jgi:hypothetical protein
MALLFLRGFCAFCETRVAKAAMPAESRDAFHMRYLPALEPLESRIAPAGLVAVNYNATTGALTLTGDSAANAFDVIFVAPGVFRVLGQDDAGTLTDTFIGQAGDTAMTFAKVTSLTISAGEGNDAIRLFNLRTLQSLTADLGGGNDSLDTLNLGVKGSVSISSGTGNDALEFDGLSTSVGGNFTINDADGGVVAEFAAALNSIRGSLSLGGSNGNDSLLTAADARLKVGKEVNFNGGTGGTNILTFGNQGLIQIGRNLQGNSVIFTGGSGADRLSIGANTVLMAGAVVMQGGLGNDLLDLDGVRVSVGANADGTSVSLTGDAGADEIDIR